MKKVLLAIFMTFGMLLTACSGGANNASEPPGTKADNASGDTAQKEAAPANNESAAGENVTITYANFSASGDNEPLLAKMKEEFEKQHPNIKVEIETIGYDEYFTQLQTRVAGGNAPDAYELNYENFVAYAKKGVLRELTPYVESSGADLSVLNENALNAFRSDGTQYGLPNSFSNVVLFYNKDLFDQAGVAYPTSDWTWQDEQAAAEKIRALGDDIYGIFHPVQFWEFYKVVQQNGGSLMSADGKQFTVNTPENVETLQFMADRILKTNVMPSDAQMAGMGDWDLFKSGKLGMLVTGIWAFPDFEKNVTFNWDVAVEPGMKRKATHFFSNGVVINQESKHPEAAFEWIRFLSSSKEAAKIRVEAGWELPASNYSDVLDMYLQKTPPENKEAVFESLNHLVTPPVVEQNAEMTDILNQYLQKAKEGAATPAEALESAQKELEAKIKLE